MLFALVSVTMVIFGLTTVWTLYRARWGR
jgi:hypothetical protein